LGASELSILSLLLYYMLSCLSVLLSFFFHAPPASEIYTLSLHDALPIYSGNAAAGDHVAGAAGRGLGDPSPARCARGRCRVGARSEEHTSELQSRFDLVCRLLLEKKKKQQEWTL